MEVENAYRPPQADMEAPPPLPGMAPAVPLFFQTSPLKVALLSVATFGLYQLYWFYRQWSQRKVQGEDVNPFLRSIFGVLFAHSLFQSVNMEIDVRQAANREPLSAGFHIQPLNAGLLALVFFLLNLLWRLNGLLGLVSCVPLMIAQKKMNEVHADLGLDPRQGFSFTAGTIVALVLGGLFWILVLIGLAQS